MSKPIVSVAGFVALLKKEEILPESGLDLVAIAMHRNLILPILKEVKISKASQGKVCR